MESQNRKVGGTFGHLKIFHSVRELSELGIQGQTMG